MMPPSPRPQLGGPIAVGIGAVLATVPVLLTQGRTPWCACGSVAPWSFDIWSRHNSQHLVDPYSATHVLHGLAFYALLWAIARPITVGWRGALAVVAECIWEIAENGDAIIQKYREATISLDYFGDSVANSISDIVMCAVGFVIAARIPPKASVALFLLTELVLLVTIRDSLIVNVIMLLWPVAWLKRWQMGA